MKSVSRKRFEASMQTKFRSIDELFKAFSRYPPNDRWAPGKYVRHEIESMWQGWELRRLADAAPPVEAAER